jgi:hypothetical protein
VRTWNGLHKKQFSLKQVEHNHLYMYFFFNLSSPLCTVPGETTANQVVRKLYMRCNLRLETRNSVNMLIFTDH